MGKSFARVSSVLFHPSILQLVGYVLIWYFYADYRRISLRGVRYVGSAVLLFTWGVPLFMYAVLKLTGRIQSLALEERTERNLPYFITFLSYFACWKLFSGSHMPGVIAPYTLASAAVVGACAVGNLFTKVSAHMAGCGGITAFIIFSHFFGEADVRWILAAILIVTGLTWSARKQLDAHTSSELVIGYVSGLLVSGITLFGAYVLF